jgi:hypothetical protein
MENSTNQEIEITSVYFRNSNNKQRLESYPKRMVYKGREYSFLEDGWRYLVQSGQELVKLFDMSDGNTKYRLKQDQSNHWTLIAMRAQKLDFKVRTFA